MIFHASKSSVFLSNNKLLNIERLLLYFNDIDALSKEKQRKQMGKGSL